MAVKPETRFRMGVEKHLPRTLYRVKMNNPFVGGIPDSWYSGNKADLWVEYKFEPRVPQRGVLTAALSPLQKQWLGSRYREGRNVVVIVGAASSGVILRDLEWEAEFSVDRSIPQAAIAEWIVQQTTR